MVSCLVIPHITNRLPNVEIDTSTLNLPANIELADPSFFNPSDIHMLLGADVFWEIVHGHQIITIRLVDSFNTAKYRFFSLEKNSTGFRF